VANDSGLLRWTLCILREIDSGVDSKLLLRWTHFMSREIDSGVLLYKSYRLSVRLKKRPSNVDARAWIHADFLIMAITCFVTK